LPRKSWVKIGQIRTLSLERIGARLARAMPETLDQVVEALEAIPKAADDISLRWALTTMRFANSPRLDCLPINLEGTFVLQLAFCSNVVT
jgi:hypothetical protein